jgi:trehalose 6-phosphate phosphatase
MTSPPIPEMQEAEALIRQSSHVLLGLDYDGTLTPIVEEPARALLPLAMKQTIWALNRREDVTVTVMSGRAQADLQELVGIPEIIYAGNHGLEISGPGLSFIEPFARAASQELHVIAQAIGRKLHHLQGAFVEDKGLTLSVHHRRVAAVDAEEVRVVVDDALKEHTDHFHVTLGNKVYEVRPRTAWNKDAAIKWIKRQIKQPEALVVYSGNDRADKDIVPSSHGADVTIKVGDDGVTAARFFLSDTTAVQEFLRWVVSLRENNSHLAYDVEDSDFQG